MDKLAYNLRDDIWLDARRAIWFADSRILAVADPHLGYAWVQRARGNLFPLTPDSTVMRLSALCQHYRPERIVLAGDIVHSAASIPALVEELRHLVSAIRETKAELLLVLGNHDCSLEALLSQHGIKARVKDKFACGPHIFIHGDGEPPVIEDKRGLIIMGHEHPAIRIGDGVASAVKYPCFLVSDDLIVLPAFSEWAAGTPFGSYPFMSKLASNAAFKLAVAIVGDRLLPIATDRLNT